MSLERLIGGGMQTIEPDINHRTFWITLAELNAGKVLVPGHNGVQYRVVDFVVNPIAAVGAVTDVRIGDTAGTPIVAATLAQAQLTAGVNLRPGDTGVTLGNGYWYALTVGKGIQVYQTGTAATGVGRLRIQLSWQIIRGGGNQVPTSTTSSTTSTTTTTTTTTTT